MIEKGFKFIDLFCGIGGFHQAMSSLGGECVFASDIDKHCQETYFENYGIRPIGDITKVDAADIPPFDVLCAGFPCLTANSLVCTDKGYKRIVDVTPGDMVLSHDGKFHAIEALMYQGTKPTYKIKTSGMVEVEATDNHKFYVRKKLTKGGRTFTEPEWKTVGEIMSDNDGTYMFGSPINKVEELPVWNGIKVWENQFNQKDINELDMTDHTLWYILGRFIGDGWVRKQWKKGDKRALYSGIVICCNKNETESLKAMIGDKYSYTISHEASTDKFHFTNTELGYFAAQFGEGADGKVIPGFVLNLPKEQLKEFIRGYEDSDGYEKDGIHRITSINTKLLYGIAHCIEKVYNVPCKISQTHKACMREIEGRLCKQSDCYRLEYRTYNPKRSKHLVENDIIWYPISSIVENGEQDVYDIQVEETHTFVVNHSITHNCQAFSLAGKKLGFADETRGTLFFDVIRIAKHHKPEYMLLENVKNLANHDEGRTWNVIYNTIREIGYNVLSEPVIFSPHYLGIPQTRERVFIMCVREDVGTVPEFKFDKKDIPECDPWKYIQDDDEIENIEAYRIPKRYEELCNHWDKLVKIYGGELPCPTINAKYLLNYDEYTDYDSLPDHIRTVVKRNHAMYNANKPALDRWLEWGKSVEMFKGCRTQLEWTTDKGPGVSIWDNFFHLRQSGLRVRRPIIFPTLVASDTRSVIGPRKRYMTPRECARIQSFPESFKINPKDRVAYKQFGNSVNVAVVTLMAKYMFGDVETRNKYSK